MLEYQKMIVVNDETSEYMATLATSEKINELLAKYPGGFDFSIGALEELSRGEHLSFHQSTIDQGKFMKDFLATLDWWLEVAREFMDGPHEFVDEAKICDVMREIFKLYPDAYEQSLDAVATGSNTSALKMLQEYWKLRGLICSSVQKELPAVNSKALSRLI